MEEAGTLFFDLFAADWVDDRNFLSHVAFLVYIKISADILPCYGVNTLGKHYANIPPAGRSIEWSVNRGLRGERSNQTLIWTQTIEVSVTPDSITQITTSDNPNFWSSLWVSPTSVFISAALYQMCSGNLNESLFFCLNSFDRDLILDSVNVVFVLLLSVVIKHRK